MTLNLPEVIKMGPTAFIIMTFSSLFAVIDPLGCIPFYSGLTSHMDKVRKRKILIKSLFTAFVVLAAFTLFGHQLLELFGITVDAFRIAGGVIFFGIGLDMLQSKPVRWRTGVRKAFYEDLEEDESDDDPSITPIAIPMLAGPGSITTVMVLAPEGPGKLAMPLVLGAVLGILILTGIILAAADAVLQKIGHTGLKIVEKLMGLVVTVIAVQLVIDGVTPVVKSMMG
jgi:multiple antibiotic resistance protein